MDLEDVEKSEIYSQSYGAYAEFSSQLKPKFRVVWKDIGLGYCLLIAVVVGMCYVESHSPRWGVVLVIPAALIVGFFIAYIQLFIHEAAHYNIHPDRKINDVLANLLIGWMVGVNVKTYRLIHWQHHVNLGTVRDTENSYFNKLTWLFILESLLGVRALKILLFRDKTIYVMKSPSGSAMRVADSFQLLLGALANMGILYVLFIFSGWCAAVVWLLGVVMFYPFFASLRQVLEHQSLTAKNGVDYTAIDHGKINRMFGKDPLSRILGGAGFNSHMLHHFDPEISYTRFEDLERYFMIVDVADDFFQKGRTSYYRTFINLLNN